MERAMRVRYASGAEDCVICGGVTDEWRIFRYMHGAHAGSEDGELFRCAGNPVFPNGFLEMELARPASGARLLVFGSAEGGKFRIHADGPEAKEAAFDASGKAELKLPDNGASTVKIRLAKAPGAGYPRFRAVVTVSGASTCTRR